MAIIWAVTLTVLCELVQGVREDIPNIPSPNVLPSEGKEEVIELRIPGARPTKVRHFTISLFSKDCRIWAHYMFQHCDKLTIIIVYTCLVFISQSVHSIIPDHLNKKSLDQIVCLV